MVQVSLTDPYYRTLRVGAAVVAALGSLLLVPSGEGAPHGPILIDGPDDICSGEQGIVNCATADGTEQAPYVIEGWEIAAPTGCVPLCEPLPACPGNGMPALVAICDVDAHFVIRSVRLDAGGASGTVWLPNDGSAPEVWPGALMIRGKGTFLVEDSQLASLGRALRVAGIGESVVTLAGVELGGAGSRLSSTLSPLVEAEGARLTLVDTFLDGSGRSVGLQASGTGSGSAGAMTFEAQRVVMSGDAPVAMEFHFADVTIVGSTIASTSVPAGEASQRSGQPQAAIWTRQGTLDVRETVVRTEGIGIHAEGTTGLASFNTFRSNQSQAVALEATRSGDVPACGLAFNNNDVVGSTVENRDESCTLDAISNWWDGDPAVVGAVATDPALPFPTSGLPRLREAAPALATHVGDQATLRLTVVGVADEVRLLAGPETGAYEASNGAWGRVLDLRDTPYGPVRVEAAACREGFCGPVLAVGFVHVEQPVSPIAVLRASHLAAAAGDEVVLSGSGSFSPQGTAIVAYRFDDGPWSPVATMVWTMPPGTVQASFSLAVRDAAGLESLNEATLTVHERAPLLGSDARQAVPGTGPWAGAAVLLASASILRRR